MKKKILALFLAVVVAAGIAGTAAIVGAAFVPDTISVISGETPSLLRAPFISINFDDDQAVETGSIGGGEVTASAELFGIIPLKTVTVKYTERQKVVLCAVPIGVRLEANGVIVAETTEVTTAEGKVDPGRKCGLKAGDHILRANGEDISEASQLVELIERSEGKAVTLEVLRQDGTRVSLELTPVYSESDGCYRAGIWIRSGAAGIGVLTYYEPETGKFGGLGHAICDEVSGAIMEVERGEITSVMLTETVRGASGAPGELVGFLGDEKYGTLTQNTETGIYGFLEPGIELGQGEYEVALKQEIREGSAQIASCVPGGDGVQLYDISIEKINYDRDNPTRNMIVRVTDKELLELTGGIVQGMSGSPIIQNGRIVGAVTHVLVNDPTRGYGIFIENMLDAAG